MSWTLQLGDCVELMRSLAEASVDAIVTDPPYGLGFMGKEWDRIAAMQEWHRAWATEAYRVLKPGGHLLAFGGTRTYHRLATAVEDAGFEIRDSLAWLYGSGFPKSLDVSKAIDKTLGAKREVVATIPDRWAGKGAVLGRAAQEERAEAYVTAPATDEARAWDGWGTALKPALEPVVLARKPLDGTVAANVLTHGTGALNVDGCRIASDDPNPSIERRRGATGHLAVHGVAGSAAAAEAEGRVESRTSPARYAEPRAGEELGRWPANVLLDGEAAAQLDEQAPATGAFAPVRGTEPSAPHANVYQARARTAGAFHADFGGASRFFYTAKADQAERSIGLARVAGVDRNTHPTVKPIDVMRWLCRLVTPPGGLVLDPFTGSGTTGIAALREGFRFLGFEREAEYVELARRRIAGDAPLFNAPAVDARERP